MAEPTAGRGRVAGFLRECLKVVEATWLRTAEEPPAIRPAALRLP